MLLSVATSALADAGQAIVANSKIVVRKCDSARLAPGLVAISGYGTSVIYLDTNCRPARVLDLEGPVGVFTPDGAGGGLGLVYGRPMQYGPSGTVEFNGLATRNQLPSYLHHELVRTAWGSYMSIMAEQHGDRVDDVLVEFSADNRILRTLSLNQLLFGDRWGAVGLGEFTAAPENWLHTNSIDTLSSGIIIVSTRNLSRIQVIDWFRGEKLYDIGAGVLSSQHHARFAQDGSITVFDNGVARARSARSAIARFTLAGELIEYLPLPFFAPVYGSAQKLENGNWLVIDGPAGRVYELTPDARTVLLDVEYRGKDYVPHAKTYKSHLYRALKVPVQ